MQPNNVSSSGPSGPLPCLLSRLALYSLVTMLSGLAECSLIKIVPYFMKLFLKNNLKQTSTVKERNLHVLHSNTCTCILIFRFVDWLNVKCLTGCLTYSRRTLCTKEYSGKLMSQLQAKIKFSGPITVADYMKEALTHATEVNISCHHFSL